mmetsp:Transcript_16221/g.25186  ORF Transcript_16221/g.25186 Transcript_16221/m.25186 type:complete len:211 (-) Transcript_16221:192-824(-)
MSVWLRGRHASLSTRPFHIPGPCLSPKHRKTKSLHHGCSTFAPPLSTPGHYLQIILVGQNQDGCVSQLIHLEYALQLILGLLEPLTIRRVDHEDQGVRRPVVFLPELSYLFVASKVPGREGETSVAEGLGVSLHRRHHGLDLVIGQLAEERGLASIVQPNHYQGCLLTLEPNPREQPLKPVPQPHRSHSRSLGCPVLPQSNSSQCPGSQG